MMKIPDLISDFTVFAHRGASGYEPENTMRSMRKALELGARWLEADVFAVEGELVVFHDRRLGRTSNGKGLIEKCPLTYLRSLDAGKGEKIPLLKEVLDLIGKDYGLNIELKGSKTAGITRELLKEYRCEHRLDYEQIIVSSFNFRELALFKSICPEVRIGCLTTNIPLDYARVGEEMGAYSINVDMDFTEAGFIEDSHRRGMKFFVYTVNEPEDMIALREMGADGIFTDFPDRARKLISSQVGKSIVES